MATFAVLDGSMVSNVIVADDKEATEQALGVTLVEYDENNPAGIGWTYVDGAFIPPQPTDESDTILA